MATLQLADQASRESAAHIKQRGQGTVSLSPYFSALLPTVSQPAWPHSDWIICQPNKNKQDAFCELWAVKTRLGGKYSGLFHHLLIVLFHSPRHRVRRETWLCKNTKQGSTRENKSRASRREGNETVMYDTVTQGGARGGEAHVCVFGFNRYTFRAWWNKTVSPFHYKLYQQKWLKVGTLRNR